jgi:hypothetical protein
MVVVLEKVLRVTSSPRVIFFKKKNDGFLAISTGDISCLKTPTIDDLDLKQLIYHG